MDPTGKFDGEHDENALEFLIFRLSHILNDSGKGWSRCFCLLQPAKSQTLSNIFAVLAPMEIQSVSNSSRFGQARSNGQRCSLLVMDLFTWTKRMYSTRPLFQTKLTSRYVSSILIHIRRFHLFDACWHEKTSYTGGAEEGIISSRDQVMKSWGWGGDPCDPCDVGSGGGGSINAGTPQWLFFVRENPTFSGW